MGLRHVAALGLALLLLSGACGPRHAAVLGQAGRQVSGCAEALRERAAATDAIDVAEKRALGRNGFWAGQLQATAAEAKGAVMGAADLRTCGNGSGGVAVDVADLRARYRAIVDRATTRLDQIAAQPIPAPPTQRGKDKKDDDD